MAAFHETQFPVNISYGSRGGPRRLTQVVTLKSGYEERNQAWQHSRRKYDAAIGLRNIADLHDVLRFWEARRGQLYGFRWKDWSDYKSGFGRTIPTATDVIIGTGDGTNTVFHLVKRYEDVNEEYVRPITKPVADTVIVAIDGDRIDGYAVSHSHGVVVLGNAPEAGALITAGFEFDVPARFDADELNISIDAFEAGTMPDINVIEIRQPTNISQTAIDALQLEALANGLQEFTNALQQRINALQEAVTALQPVAADELQQTVIDDLYLEIDSLREEIDTLQRVIDGLQQTVTHTSQQALIDGLRREIDALLPDIDALQRALLFDYLNAIDINEAVNTHWTTTWGTV